MWHVAPFLKVIKGAKFEQCHYFIFGDIFDYEKKKIIFFSMRERAEFNKSCNLIGSGSGRNFPIRPALGGRNHKKCFKFVWKPFK